MKIRLSNGYSFAVEFSANNPNEFRKNIFLAAMEYFSREGKKSLGQLHVKTDSGEWVSANYPKSNAHYYIKFGKIDSAAWIDVANSNSSGSWFECELEKISKFSRENIPNLTIVPK